MTLSRTIPLLALLLPLAACGRGPLEGVACPAVARPAVMVEVLDSVTLRPAAGGAEGWVRDGAYSDSLRVVGWTGPEIGDSTALHMAAAYERPGTHTVEISRPGYVDWHREGVRARRGECGVETAMLTARLVPISSLPD